MAEDRQKLFSLVLHVIKLSGMSAGLFYFIFLIVSDNWSALRSKPRTWWIPGKALILSALSIQVLSYLDYSNISFSDNPNGDDVAKLLGNQLVIDSGRLVICVFIGYLLPGMATRGSAQASSDIVALVVSLFTAIISELFFVHKAAHIFNKVDYNYVYDFFNQWESNPEIKTWFIVSSCVFLVAIILLILFLVSAIIAGKTVRCMLKQRINSQIPLNKPHQAEECWEKFDDEVVKQWLLCRAAQPQYVIARSVLSSSTGLVVTISIVLFVAKTLKLSSSILDIHDGLDWLRHITFGLQCLFVLLGGWVIFRRWFMAVIYFGFKCSFSWRPRCSVEDYWTRSILELINMYEWRRDQKPAADNACFGGIFMKVFTQFKLHKLLYCVWALQKSLVWFSKCCWLFSEMFFGSTLMRKAIIGDDRRFFSHDVPYKDMLKHVCMPGENPASLWLTNKDSIDQAKVRIEKGKNSKRKELIDIIRKRPVRPCEARFAYGLESLQLVKKYFPTLNDNWWKMTAVSLLRIIVKLEDSKKDGGTEAYQQAESKKDEAINAYKQAWDLMNFVESSSTEQPNSIDVTQVFDIEADLVSMVADREFKRLADRELKRPSNPHEIVRVLSQQNAWNVIEEEMNEAGNLLKAQGLLTGGREETPQDTEKPDVQIVQDSKDWNKIVPSYSMYRVCKKFKSYRIDPEAMVPDLHMCLGDVIADCLEQLPSILIRSFGEWVLEYQEDNMWEALYIVGKSMKVLQDSELKPNWKRA